MEYISTARSSGSPWSLKRLTMVVLALGLCACDRDDLTSGSELQNDEDVEPPPCEGDDCGPPPLPAGVQLKINELMVENTSTLQDEDGEFPPWIEIHNLSELEFTLAGVTLSDDLLNPIKWTIPDIPEAVIEPFGFVVIFADGGQEPDDLHASFTLTRSTNTLVMNGGLLDLIVGLNLTSLAADRTVGRFPDGQRGALKLLEEPTPGEANAPFDEGTPPPPQEADFIRGDVNEDDAVTVSDMVGIQLIVAGARPLPDCAKRADANDDGVVSGLDPIAVGNAVFREQPLPPPYPNPGMDPTPDALPCVAD